MFYIPAGRIETAQATHGLCTKHYWYLFATTPPATAWGRGCALATGFSLSAAQVESRDVTTENISGENLTDSDRFMYLLLSRPKGL